MIGRLGDWLIEGKLVWYVKHRFGRKSMAYGARTATEALLLIATMQYEVRSMIETGCNKLQHEFKVCRQRVNLTLYLWCCDIQFSELHEPPLLLTFDKPLLSITRTCKDVSMVYNDNSRFHPLTGSRGSPTWCIDLSSQIQRECWSRSKSRQGTAYRYPLKPYIWLRYRSLRSTHWTRPRLHLLLSLYRESHSSNLIDLCLALGYRTERKHHGPVVYWIRYGHII